MVNELRKLLDDAKGSTEHIIAIVLDIRGFTPFCKEEESINVANFLKRVYTRIIDDYFPKASFYKPTGDGLLIIIKYTSDSLKDAVAYTMTTCLRLLVDFKKLREGDDMIYFPTPEMVGIGISRGAACCISSGETIIDYSGRVINLAARLNDFARPSGIVFDAGLGMTLLPKDMRELFLCDNVFIRGIAEDKHISVCFTKNHTIIPDSRKQPLNEPEWVEQQSDIRTYKELKEDFASGVTVYGISLDRKPSDEKQINIQLFYDFDEQRFVFLKTSDAGVRVRTTGTRYFVGIEGSMIMKDFDESGAKDDSKVTMVITYPAVPKRD